MSTVKDFRSKSEAAISVINLSPGTADWNISAASFLASSPKSFPRYLIAYSVSRTNNGDSSYFISSKNYILSSVLNFRIIGYMRQIKLSLWIFMLNSVISWDCEVTKILERLRLESLSNACKMFWKGFFYHVRKLVSLFHWTNIWNPLWRMHEHQKAYVQIICPK